MPEHLSNAEVSRERSDFNLRAVVWVFVGVAGLVALTIGALWLLFNYFDRREQRQKGDAPPLVAAEGERRAELPEAERLRRHADGRPLLEGLPPDDPIHRVGPWHPRSGESQAAAERERLEGYGWVNQEKGIVRVPLERAQRLALENRAKYLPAQKENK